MRFLFADIVQKLVRHRSEIVVKRVMPYIKNSSKIIDIGSGTGDVALLLEKIGNKVTAVDVGNFRGPRLVKTTIYNGQTLPFRDGSFDIALLITVLHHTPSPEIVFAEASRVANEVLVIETSYKSAVSKVLTVVSDAIGNLRL